MSAITQNLEFVCRRVECTLKYAKQMTEAGKGPSQVLMSWDRGFTALPATTSDLERLKKRVVNHDTSRSPAQRGHLAVYNGDETGLCLLGIFWNNDSLPFGEPKVEVLG